jgi:2-oxoglutarate dehydrogenase E2 component (dihydrolipoamide succinyltransferase)
MIVEVKVPSPGESITEVEIAEWLVSDGDIVEKDQELAEIESEKATLSIVAEEAGKVSIKHDSNKSLKVGEVACTIDTDYADQAGKEDEEDTATEDASDADESKQPDNSGDDKQSESSDQEAKAEKDEEAGQPEDSKEQDEKNGESQEKAKISPLARRLMEEKGLSLEDVVNGLARITKADVEQVAEMSSGQQSSGKKRQREEQREEMSSLRKKLSDRLVSVKNETAMLTTFNEIDMSRLMKIRSENKHAFIDKHGVKPGFMSFFTKASALALKEFPNVNAYIDGDEVVSHTYADIGIAVQTPKGLMVPVVRDADVKNIPELEKDIQEIANKARNKKINLDDLKGGTFSITNGGVFGSLLSTPILNPPQAAILGMHNIQERPVAVDGQVVIKPMMYVALSYDHRLVDGKESVSFLKKIKEIIENPEHFLTNGVNPVKTILDL